MAQNSNGCGFQQMLVQETPVYGIRRKKKKPAKKRSSKMKGRFK